MYCIVEQKQVWLLVGYDKWNKVALLNDTQKDESLGCSHITFDKRNPVIGF